MICNNVDIFTFNIQLFIHAFFFEFLLFLFRNMQTYTLGRTGSPIALELPLVILKWNWTNFWSRYQMSQMGEDWPLEVLKPSSSILDQVRRVQIVWIFYIYVLFYSTDKWLQSNSFGDDAQNLPKKKKIFNFPWISVSQDFNFSEFQFLCISVSPGFSVFVFQCHPLLL